MHAKFSFLPILYDNRNVLVHNFYFENIFDPWYILLSYDDCSFYVTYYRSKNTFFFKDAFEYKILLFFEQSYLFFEDAKVLCDTPQAPFYFLTS